MHFVDKDLFGGSYGAGTMEFLRQELGVPSILKLELLILKNHLLVSESYKVTS